jgi:hypothetical protein
MEITDKVRRSPEYAKYYYEQMNTQKEKAIAQQDSRRLANWAKTSGYLGDEAQAGIPSNDPALQSQEGSGVHTEGFNPQRKEMMLRNQALLSSGIPSLQEQAMSQMGTMQSSRNSGLNSLELEGYKLKNAPPKKADTKLEQLMQYKKELTDSGQDTTSVDAALMKESTHSKLVDVNVGGSPPYKIPPGYMMKDPSRPELGVEAIPGAPKEKVAVGDASKIQSMRLAKSFIPTIEEILFQTDENGELMPNNYNILMADANTPFSDGRTANGLYEQGIQAITRGETGAAMPPEEVANTRKRFQPNSLDSDALKWAKWNSFRLFLGGTLRLIDPDGNFMTSRFNETIESQAADKENGIIARQPAKDDKGDFVRLENGQWQREVQ